MIKDWTGQLVGRMHNYRVTYEELARELGVSRAYVSMVLNGARDPADAETRFNAACDNILAGRALPAEGRGDI